MLYIIGVSTPIPQRGNLKCLKYIVGVTVRSLNTFQQAVLLLLLFVFFLHGCYFEIPVKKKSMGMDGHTHNVWAGIFTETPV